MQVPNVLDSLRNNKEPSFEAPIQWTGPTSEWKDDQELYARLKSIYDKEKTPASAQHWVSFMDTLRPIDWPYFTDFFTTCPTAYQTPAQLEVTSPKKSKNSDIVAMQLLHCFDKKDPKFDALLRTERSMNSLEIKQLSDIAQHVWEHSEALIATKHLPARIVQFLEDYPHEVEVHEFPNAGVGLLVATILIGTKDPSFCVNNGDDERYYNTACANASQHDVDRLVQCLQRHPEWCQRIRNEFEMNWFDPFLQERNPHRGVLGMYHSLDPHMKLDGLSYFLKQHTQPAAESYSLESISIS